jgi:uroporphyrinogen-III synthase
MAALPFAGSSDVAPAPAGAEPAVPILIVTRPAAQASAWVQALREMGCEAQALPLIGIDQAPDPALVARCWQELQHFSVVMFVSANAVAGFFGFRPAGTAWPASVIAASTGPGTSAALRAAGLAAAQIVEPCANSPQFDSEALWLQLQCRFGDWRERRVLVVRGEEGRDWLGDTLRGMGARVEYVAAYQRRAPQPDAAGLSLLAAAQLHPELHVWLFSSSQAVAHLQQLAPQAGWRRSQAWVTHPRIGQAACEAGFGHVLEMRPGVMAAAQQLRSGAWRAPYNPQPCE